MELGVTGGDGAEGVGESGVAVVCPGNYTAMPYQHSNSRGNPASHTRGCEPAFAHPCVQTRPAAVHRRPV